VTLPNLKQSGTVPFVSLAYLGDSRLEFPAKPGTRKSQLLMKGVLKKISFLILGLSPSSTSRLQLVLTSAMSIGPVAELTYDRCQMPQKALNKPRLSVLNCPAHVPGLVFKFSIHILPYRFSGCLLWPRTAIRDKPQQRRDIISKVAADRSDIALFEGLPSVERIADLDRVSAVEGLLFIKAPIALFALGCIGISFSLCHADFVQELQCLASDLMRRRQGGLFV
jgi:hypothetical protein